MNIFEMLLQLVILFFVIFDPFASLLVFITASANMNRKERRVTATLAVLVALSISLFVLFLGHNLLSIFSTTIDEFRIAGGIILSILGVKMALGIPLTDINKVRNNSGRAIAAIIGTPMLTGPATITAIIIAVNDYGMFLTGIAILIVLVLTAFIFYQTETINKLMGPTAMQVLSTILGLITLAWGVKFITHGILALL